MNNIALITGANGMDAKCLTHFLLNKGYKVILTYRRNSFFDTDNIKSLFTDDLIKNPNSELYCEVCDISCQNSINECIKSILKHHSRIDELYLLAAMSHVGYSFKQKDLCIQTNGQSYYYFLECLKNFSPNTKVYGAMTSELAGNVPDGTYFNEESKWDLKSPYSIGKNLGANWIKFYRESSDSKLFACFGVLFNHSCQYRTLDFASRKITNTAAKIALGKSKELKLAHLNWARDEHWASFGTEAMWKMLQLKTPTDLVIGTGQTHWCEEYLDNAFNYFNLDWKKYVILDDSLQRPNEVVRLIADSSKAQKTIGWRPHRMSFKDHIGLMCAFDLSLEKGEKPVRPDVFKMFP